MAFANKVVVVTGGNCGIGAAAAILFTKEGANVVISGRNEKNLEAVAKRCEEHGKRPLIIKADVSKEEETTSIITKTIQKFNRLDVLVNNAGYLNNKTILSGKIMEAFDEVMNINLRAIVLLTSLAAPHLVKTKGNIVNISSVPWPDNLTLSVSKAALDHFTKCAALELGPKGVRVNAIKPSCVLTENLITDYGNILDRLKERSALGKIAESSDIAKLVLFLASDDSAASITGAEYLIDNGSLLLSPEIFPPEN